VETKNLGLILVLGIVEKWNSALGGREGKE